MALIRPTRGSTMEIVAVIATGAVLGTAALISTEFGKVISMWYLLLYNMRN